MYDYVSQWVDNCTYIYYYFYITILHSGIIYKIYNFSWTRIYSIKL